MLSTIYSRLTSTDKEESKASPLKKKAGEIFKKISKFGSGDFTDYDDERKNSDEIFDEADCADLQGNENERFYQLQIKDTKGKDKVDEKVVAEVTGAKEVLQK